MDEFVTLDSISASVIFPNCGHLVYSNALPPKKGCIHFLGNCNDRTLALRSSDFVNRDLQQDDDGSENAGKKVNLRSFKLHRVYLDPFNMSNAGDFYWS